MQLTSQHEMRVCRKARLARGRFELSGQHLTAKITFSPPITWERSSNFGRWIEALHSIIRAFRFQLEGDRWLFTAIWVKVMPWLMGSASK